MPTKNDYYKKVFNEISHPVIILGPHFKLLEANNATREATGKTEKELRGMYCYEVFHSDGKSPKNCPMKSLLQSGRRERAVMEVEALGGHYLVDCNPVFDEEGNLEKVIHTATDITHLKETRKAFKQFENRHKTYIEHAPTGVFITDKAGKFIEVNPAACESTGFSKDELQQRSIPEMLPEDDREKGLSLFQKAIDEGKSSGEVAFLTKEGEKRYWQVDSVKLSDERYMGFVSDITEKRMALAKKEESEQKFRALYENAPLPYQSLDIEGNILDVNPSWLRTLGYEREEVIGTNFSQFLHPEWEDHFRQNFPAFKKQGYIHDVQFKIGHKNGDYLDITFEGSSGYYPDGSFRQTYCVFKNITAQKKAEQKLLESERKNRTLIGNLPGMAYRCRNDRDWTMEFVSEGCQDLTGYRPDDMVNNKVVSYGSLVHPSDRNDVWKAVQNAIDAASHFETEYRIITKNKERKWIWERGLCVSTTPDGTNILEGFMSDITERKQAEAKLRENKYFLDAVFESIQDGISVINPDLTIRHTNKVMKKWYSESTPLEGKKCFTCYHNASQPCDPCPTLRAMKTGKTEKNIVPGYPGASVKWIELYSYPMRNPELNKVTGVVEFVRDITDRVEATEKLKASEKRFNLAMKASQDGLFDWNPKTQEVYLSPMWKKILGYEDHELSNEFSVWEKLTHPEDLKKAWGPIKELLDGKRDRFEIEFRMKHKEGHWVYILSRAEGVFDERGNTIRVVGTHLDITDLKSTEYHLKEKNEEYESLNEELRQINEDLIEAKNKAEESDRLKSAFLANMSHEIRTPMNGIIGFTDILKEPSLQEELRQTYISIIQKSGQRLQNTVNDLIEISKIETGQMSVFTEQVDIPEVMQNHYDFFAPEAKTKGLQFEIHLPPESESVIAETDISKLESVLTNLIKNAIKYTRQGSIEMGVEIYENHLLFYVKDTGMGVPAGRQEAIFNRFEQADIEDTEVFEGSGLGLAISKSYLEMLGGQIWVESGEGQGSCFYFTLPYLAAEQKQPAKNQTEEELIDDIKQKKLTVLIAEDEESSEFFLHEVLKNHVKKIIHAKNGRETVEWVKIDPGIDLVLMDIKMPIMDGYEATRWIREFNPDIKIIAQTAYALEGDREKALASGCDAYMDKPLSKKKLFNLINNLWL